MLPVIVVAAILSIQLVSVHSGTVEKCLGGNHHKTFPSPGGPGFDTCFPWKNKACCLTEITVKLRDKTMDVDIVDWNYCGKISEGCRKYLINHLCLYYCDPNMVKWEASPGYTSKVPICSDTCDKWFEACKNDKTYSKNWMDDYVLYHSQKAPIVPDQPCQTFAEVFKNGEGLCNNIYGPTIMYEKSSNCLVMDFQGENPNDKVVPLT